MNATEHYHGQIEHETRNDGKRPKSNISYFFAVFFTVAFLITYRFFDSEAAGMFIIFALVAFISAIINFKLNR